MYHMRINAVFMQIRQDALVLSTMYHVVAVFLNIVAVVVNFVLQFHQPTLVVFAETGELHFVPIRVPEVHKWFIRQIFNCVS